MTIEQRDDQDSREREILKRIANLTHQRNRAVEPYEREIARLWMMLMPQPVMLDAVTGKIIHNAPSRLEQIQEIVMQLQARELDQQRAANPFISLRSR